METEGLLPHSQVPSKCPYTTPARSSPYPHILLPEYSCQYYPPIYAWVSQVVSFLEVSPQTPCMRLSSHPYSLHAPSNSFFSILPPEQYWVRSTELCICRVLHSPVTSSLLKIIIEKHNY